MSAKPDRVSRTVLRRLAMTLLVLAACGPAGWAAPAGDVEPDAGDADHADESDVPSVAALPRPGPALRWIPDAPGPSASGPVRRLFRPPGA